VTAGKTDGAYGSYGSNGAYGWEFLELGKMGERYIPELPVFSELPDFENRCAGRVSKVSESAVQNGFGVAPSVPDGGSEPLSQSESTAPENILHTSVWNVQNVV